MENIKICFEFQVNGFHLMGDKNCVACNEIKQSQIPTPVKQKTPKPNKVSKQVEANDVIALAEKFGDCPCCSGVVFDCNGEICKELGACYCFLKYEQEQ